MSRFGFLSLAYSLAHLCGLFMYSLFFKYFILYIRLVNRSKSKENSVVFFLWHTILILAPQKRQAHEKKEPAKKKQQKSACGLSIHTIFETKLPPACDKIAKEHDRKKTIRNIIIISGNIVRFEKCISHLPAGLNSIE